MRASFITLLFLFACFACFAQDYRAIADTCYQQGDYECARENYGLYLIHSPADSVVTALKDKADECAMYLRDADDNYKKRNFQVALLSYDEILKINPRDRHSISQYDSCVYYLKPKPSPARADLQSVRPDTAAVPTNKNASVVSNQKKETEEKLITVTNQQVKDNVVSKKKSTFGTKLKKVITNQHFYMESDIISGFTGGYTTLLDKSSYNLYEGFQFGLCIEPLFKNGLGIHTGLYAYLYGYKENIKQKIVSHDDELAYISIPLHLKYRVHFADNSFLFVYSGLSVDVMPDVDDFFSSQSEWNLYLDVGGGINFAKYFQINAGTGFSKNKTKPLIFSITLLFFPDF